MKQCPVPGMEIEGVALGRPTARLVGNIGLFSALLARVKEHVGLVEAVIPDARDRQKVF